jgi:hypothetical protein
MLQQTKSLYLHRNANLQIPISIENQETNSWSEKLYTQQEVNELLDKKNNFPSIETELIQESQTADKQKRKDIKTVANLVKKSNRILISITSHAFPFDFFPDVINVEEGRVTIINRHFLSSEVHSIDIKDISNVFINRTFIFSQLVIISRTYEDNEIRMRNLRTKEAVYVRRIIEGLRIFENKQIDTSSYSKETLIAKLEQLSTTKIVT